MCTDVALISFHNSTVLATCFNVKVKNLAFYTSKVITNAWFSMKTRWQSNIVVYMWMIFLFVLL